MLEGLVAGLLNRFLGMYVKNFDPAQLKVGIWGGDVKLRDLELRKEALDQLKLPINVVEGHLGELTLVIPWSNLRGAPVKVFIENVFLLASPKEEAAYNEEEEERRTQRIKMEKLDSAELLKERSQEGLSQEEQKRSQSFTASLVTKIVDNLQVTVKNIHVRYEDSISAPGHPFALGVTLEEFSAISTDGEWKPTFIQDSTKTTHKLATLGALSVYWNTDTKLYGTGKETSSSDKPPMEHDEMIKTFKAMIGKADENIGVDHQFILKPVSGQAKIEMDKSGDVRAPKWKANLLFDEIGIVLDDHQYRDALMLVDLFHYFIRHQEYKKYQPKGVTPKEDPRAWLKFAGDAVLSKIHERNRRWSWDYFRERRDDRLRYIELFKKKKANQQLSADETEDFNKLEWKLDYEDLRFWRSLARNQLRKENAAALKNSQPKQEQQQQQGWVAWMWGSKPQEHTTASDENTQMTEEQRQELYEAIDWDEKAALADAVETPRDSVKFQVETSLSTGSFTLKRNPHGQITDVVSLHFDVFKAKALVRPDSFLTDVSLGGLRVNDGTTPNSQFPEIVRVKDAPETQKNKRLSMVELEKTTDEAFFQLQLEQNPLDGQGDFAVKTKLKPLEVIWNPNLVVGVVDFFKPPERHMESITALMETAGATVEDFRQQTRAGLEFALEEHKTINAVLDLQAPLIIIPESITTPKSTCMILDAGHISVNSELVDKETMKEVQSKQKQAYTDEDFKRLESLMYDKFIVKLTSTQLLIGPSIEEAKSQLTDNGEGSKMHIVEQINIDFLVQLSILPKAPNLAKLRVSGHLPLLHVTASDTKYKSLMKLIDVAMPKFHGDTLGDQPQPKRPRLLSNISTRSDRSSHSQLPSPRHHRKQSSDLRRRSSQLLPFVATKDQAIVLDDIDEDEDNFEDADDGHSNVHLKLKQKTFELKFTVDELRGSLYQSDPDGVKPDALLVELIAQSFEVNYYLRPFDMVADVSLGSVTVDDFVGKPSAEFKSIISSGDVEDKKQHRALVKVNVVRVKKESPEFMSVYEGVETNVNVAITTINLIVTRKTLLTLLDFILVTFTNPGGNNQQQQKAITDDGSELDVAVEPPPEPQQNAAGAIRVKVDLKSIQLVLNNDGIRLATLSFNQADVGVFILGSTMRVSTKLGDLSLVDDVNLGVSEDSSIRKLITIQGDDLADFRYETFDSKDEKSYPGYDSSIFLRAGSVKVNFLEEPFRKIVEFLVKFGKMQAIYNAARQAAANQAQQLQQGSSRIKLDVVINTPILVFPSVVTPGQPKRDLITAYLGEIYAQNKFAPLDDAENSEVAMMLSAGIRNIKLTSLFHYADQSEELELIDHLDLGFNIVYAEHKQGAKRPELEIEGNMTDFNVKITQYQLKALLAISRSVPAAFSGDSDAQEEAEQAVDDSTLRRAQTLPRVELPSEDDTVDMGPELGSRSDTWTKLDLVFRVGTIGLELINAHKDRPVGNLQSASLSKFSLDDSRLKTRIQANGSLEAEFVIQSFTIYDSRPNDTNKFRRIMTSSNKSVQQFMASVTMSGGKERNLIAMVAIDSPRIIFALDYLFALQNFLLAGLQVDDPLPIEEGDLETPSESDADSMQVSIARRPSGVKSTRSSLSTRAGQRTDDKNEDESKMSIAYRVNIVDAQVILIANPLSASSEAVVLGTKQVLLSQQHALTFQVSEVGMFLCRMDRFDDLRLRIIDDFSVQMSMDTSNPSKTSLHLELDPLILRLALRDILLVLQIVSKASELSEGDEDKTKKPGAAEQKAKELTQGGLKQRSASGKGASTIAGKARSSKTAATKGAQSTSRSGASSGQPHDIAKKPQRREELTATIQGIRVVLIGDLHELPILDLSIKDFTATAEDWSSNLKAEVPLEMYVNIYNFSKSAWEPLLEPWAVGVGVAREQGTGLLSVDVASRKTFDVTITTNSIALASKSFAFLTQDQDVLGKPRGTESPYRIRNYTGFDVVVRSKSPSSEEDINVRLEDGQEAPWSFEHWEKMRENVMTDAMASTAVAVHLEGSGFDVLRNIRLNREGEFIYSLKPKKDDISHRLMVDVKLGNDNVKYVTLRSPLLVENQTQIPVELGVYDAPEQSLLKIEKIAPGEARPAPVGAVFEKTLLVRPDSGFGYSWSSETLWWRDLLKRPTRTMICKGEQGEPFYFQMNATFDRTNPMTKNYPNMKIKLSAPVTLENLLPYDFKYRIYDKNTKKDWSNFLRKGGVSPVHVTELSHLLLLSVDMQDTVFKASEFAIINSGSSDDFKKESTLRCQDEQGLQLNLKLHYHRVPDSGGAFKVTVYSPYVILNKTGLDLQIRHKGFLQQAKAAAGQLLVDVGNDERKVAPLMFSYGSDDHRNRAMLKVGDSEWSKPQSFDAIGSTTDVSLQSSNRNSEVHIGITVEPGEGKYKMTKVVTLAPRFIVQNKIGEEINIREPSSSNLVTLSAGQLQPLHFLQRNAVKQLCLCYPGVDNQWTSPFNISDLGTTHIKIAKAGQRQRLIRVEILMEDATIFLKLGMETKQWPFSMRNESDTEFTFYQANPNIDEEETVDRSGWRPIRYRLPPRSIMPYAWDFPAAKRREIVISAYSKERHVKLAEIGNLVPMRLATNSGGQKIIDINVAADGPTQTLILSNFRQSKSLYRQKTGFGSSGNLSTGGFEAKDQDTGTTFRAQLKLAGIGISLINSQLKELAYVTFRDLTLRYSESPLYQSISLAVKWIQIDNQLYGGIFPMILYPSVVPKRAQETEAHPSLHAMVTRVKDDSYGVLYIKYATILLQQMTVDLDEDFIFAMLDFSKVPGATWTISEEEGRLCDDSLNIPEPSAQEAGQDIYFELLNIQPMQIDLSFVRTERINAEDKTSSRNPLMFFFNIMTMAMGNVNDAPLRMNALMLDNVRVSTPILIQNISNHYSQEALYQVHKILGSADFLGNPVGLFNNISSGIADVFYEPYQGLIMSDRPEDLGLGVARGAASFFKKSVFGVTDSFSKFTGAMSKGLAAATLDKQFQDRRRITRARNRPKHALYGFTTGANSFITSVASGVGGVVRKPLEGAEQEGALGFFKGVGKGVLGLGTKPLIGVLDAASNVTEGIRNTTTVFDGSELDRVRITRFIPSDGIVRPYNQREALGQFWMKQVDNGKYFDEMYIAHLELPREDMVVMVTYARILLIRSRRLTTEWDVPLKDVQTIAKERTGLSLTLRGGTNGPFIPIGEESGRTFIYRMVGVAVEEFNRRFRGLE
ncbi:vacuolar protein sorting-associated protein 13 [Cryphonectria parasitica EP155]|uniref:Vacuolar protein sorting-associated protein 13 n=1 Tax=Cryphonectria parasitica (strain ATCC 38755 / EP155) TaxID=660469 RepID=A0A9P4Y392_CRYP1|nr:vacuolar protein sorting-associated protein 13 [Cryphonectria parasitica EP155]KAF3765567.1 vacuolar protein sorting-associated protein 13 [Cryphonectria parasitica EP155]